MARAKRTDRAEARRRYRAYLAQVEGEEVEGVEPVEGVVDEGRPSARAAAPRSGQSVGFFASIRAAMRPVHYVEDLRYLPKLVTGTPAIWLPSLIAIASTVLAISRVNSGTREQVINDPLFSMLLGFVISLPMLPAFIAGFFAPRASWLAGALVSVVTTIGYGAVVASRPELFTANGAKIGSDQVISETALAMLYSAPLGAVVAAFSAWYKRFLDLTGQSAARRRIATQKQAAKQPGGKRR